MLGRIWLALLVLFAVTGVAAAADPAPSAGEPPVPPITDFAVTSTEVVAERDNPQACFGFSQRLSKAPEVTYASFVEAAPAQKVTVVARDRTLCVDGLSHGSKVAITLREGLPGADGVQLAQSAHYELEIPNRAPSLAFRGAGYMQPQVAPEGLSLRTINVAAARLQVLRIGDRNLVEKIYFGKISQSMSDWDIGELVEKTGKSVWKAELPISGNRNTPVVTPFPVDAVLGKLEPGIYLAVAAAEAADKGAGVKATQWFVVSDLALTTIVADDGLLVFARTLSSAAPANGTELRLLARNNSVLATATTGADGIARFDAAAVRGTEGKSPQALFAYGATGDFSFLDLSAPSGPASGTSPVRAANGRDGAAAVDAYLFAERGIYRPGETVGLTVLLRDADAAAVAGQKLLIKIFRPDGFEVDRREVADAGDGGYALKIALPAAAATGTWTATAQLEQQAPVLGRLEFLVEAFVPPRVDFSIEADTRSLSVSGNTTLSIAARFLYGAPAARLPGELSMTLRAAESPFPDHRGFRFGLAQDKFVPIRAELPGFTTNAAGKARVDAVLSQRPESSHPLEAVVRSTVFDIGGRPVSRELVLPVWHQPFAIGVRPRFDGDAVPEGAAVGFDVIAVDAEGHTLDREGLSYEFFEEENEFVWYESDGHWDYKAVVHDRRVTGGNLAVTAAAPTKIEEQVKAGRFRFEVFDAKTGVATSVRFAAGWWVRPTTVDRPDKVEVAMMLPGYRGGDSAWVYVRPPYRSQMVIALADRSVRAVKTREVGPEGAFLEFPVDPAWTAGVYVIANAFAPADPVARTQPRRALGLGWLAIDPGPRTLTVKLDLPWQVKPRQTVTVPVQVSGAEPGKPVRVVVAAVDETVLNLTEAAAPDPIGHYLGRRPLSADVRDLFGPLIEPETAERVRVRSGVVRSSQRQNPALPRRDSPVVSLLSGIATVDGEGRAMVPLALPDFQGRLRLSVVAWSAGKVGGGQAALVVRDPAVVDLMVPHFLAPGDHAGVVLTLENLSASRGDFTARLTASGGLAVDNGVVTIPDVDKGRRITVTPTLRAQAIGAGKLRLELSGPDGFSLTRDWVIPVRAVEPMVTRRQIGLLAPDQSLVVPEGLAAGLRPETVNLVVGLASLPDFDLPDLWRSGKRWPDAGVELLTSEGLILTGRADLVAGLGLIDGDALKGRVQRTIERLLALQRTDGAFSQWGLPGEPELWLTAYALEFLTRARAAGHAVPEASFRLGLDWLKHLTDNSWFEERELPGRAFAYLVLSRAKLVDLAAVRFFQQTYGAKPQTDLVRAQIAAALALLGDNRAAEDGFAKLGQPRQIAAGAREFGSELRDAAGAVALAAESGVVPRERLVELTAKLHKRWSEASSASLQEQAWLALAANAVVEREGPFKLAVDGQIIDLNRPFYRRLDPAAPLPAIRNAGSAPLHQVITVSGSPATPTPPASNGLTIARSLFDMSGKAVDAQAVRQNELLVVILEGRSQDDRDHQALVVDLLPAGLEIENVRSATSAQLGDLSWLGELSPARSAAAADDRFVAAIDLDRDRPGFRLVYLARAVTAGSFVQPAPIVTDLDRPDLMARGAPGEIQILPN